MNQTEKQAIETETDGVDVNHQLVIPARTETESMSYEGNFIKEKFVAMLGAFAITGLVVIGATVNFTKTETQTEVMTVAPIIKENILMPPEKPNLFHVISTKAKAIIVYDVNNDKVLFGYNEDKQLPLASITKLMTSLIATEFLDGSKNIAISPHAIETEGDSGLFANETWNISDLISFTMLTSSNDGADAIAAAVGSLWQSTSEVPEYIKVYSFVKKMNLRAKEIGLNNTKYSNATGLDDYATGGLGSAKDVSKLLTYIWKNEPSAISKTVEYEYKFVSGDGFEHVAENTNKFVNNIPGLLGSKTGYTDSAGGNLAIIYDAGMNHPIVVVVLGSTVDGRFEDVQALVDATYDYVESGWFDYEMVAGSTKKNN